MIIIQLQVHTKFLRQKSDKSIVSENFGKFELGIAANLDLSTLATIDTTTDIFRMHFRYFQNGLFQALSVQISEMLSIAAERDPM